MASLATNILTNTAAMIRPVVEAEVAADPKVSLSTVETKVLSWANTQLGNGVLGSIVKIVVDAAIELYLPGIYETAVKQTLGTNDGNAVLAAQNTASSATSPSAPEVAQATFPTAAAG